MKWPWQRCTPLWFALPSCRSPVEQISGKRADNPAVDTVPLCSKAFREAGADRAGLEASTPKELVDSLRSAFMALDTRGWLDRYAAAIGSPPISDDDVEGLLALAGVASHASERKAAPVTCYLAARAGVPIVEALVTARRLADELAEPGGQYDAD